MATVDPSKAKSIGTGVSGEDLGDLLHATATKHQKEERVTQYVDSVGPIDLTVGGEHVLFSTPKRKIFLSNYVAVRISEIVGYVGGIGQESTIVIRNSLGEDRPFSIAFDGFMGNFSDPPAVNADSLMIQMSTAEFHSLSEGDKLVLILGTPGQPAVVAESCKIMIYIAGILIQT